MSWKRILKWTALAALATTIVVIAAGFFVVRSRAFHQYLLAKIIQTAHESTGARVEIGDYTFRLRLLKADAYRLVLHGREDQGQRPLLALDHLGVALKLSSLLHLQPQLSDLVLDHPVVHVIVDQNGRNNLPQPEAPKKQTQSTNIFDLAISRFRLNNGEIYYNDSKTPLDAELHDLQVRTDYQLLKKQYDGQLVYRDGVIHYGTFNPLTHSLEMRLAADPGGVKLDQLAVNTGSSYFRLQGAMKDYNNPVIDANYQLAVVTQDFAQVLKTSALPAGHILTEGSLRYRSVPNQPFIEGVYLAGRLESPGLDVRLPQERAQIRAIRGQYWIENGDLRTRDVQADLLAGRVALDLSAKHLAANPDFRLAALLQNISLAAASAGSETPMGGRVTVAGQLNGKLTAGWQGSIDNLKAKFDAAIAAPSTAPERTSSLSSVRIPINGAIHADYDASRQFLSLAQTYLQTGQTDIRINGAIGQRASLNVQARCNDLRELDQLALALRRVTAPPSSTSHPAAAPQLMGLSGAATLNAQVQGTVKEPQVMGQLAAQNLGVQGSHWKSLRVGLQLNPSLAALQQGDLQGFQGRVQFDASVGLRHWSYTSSNPINLRLTATNLPVTDLERLANLHYPVSGILSAQISVRGTQLHPSGSGSAQLTQARVYNEPLQKLAARFEASDSSVHSNLTIQAPAGLATADLTYYPKNSGYRLDLNAKGIKLEQLQAITSRNVPITGVLTASAKGSGTFRDPQLEANLQLSRVQVRDQVFQGIQAQISVANQQAKLNVITNGNQGLINAQGTVHLTDAYYANATLDIRGMPLDPVLAAYLTSAPSDLRGQLDLHGSVQGPLKDPQLLQAVVDIPALKITARSIEIANAQPIHLAYRQGTLSLQRAELKAAGATLRMEGSVPVQGSGPLTFSAQGNLDLRVVSAFQRDAESSGQVNLDLHASGNKSHPSLRGQIRLVNASYFTTSAPLGLEGLNGEIAIQNDRIQITQFSGQVGGGNVSLQGYVTYPQPQFNITVTGNSIRVRYPDGVRAVLDSNLFLTGTTQSAKLAGQVLIKQLSLTQQFDLATFAGQFSAEGASSPSSFADNMQLDIRVQSTEELALSSQQFAMQAQSNLQVRGTAANPVILGRVNIEEGELTFLKQRYKVERSVIEFKNPVHTEPTLNLLASTRISEFDITIRMNGTIDRLRTSYTSDPPLPAVDIINLITRGQTTEASAGPNLGASSVIAQGIASQASQGVEKLAGLSSLQIDPLIGGNNRNPSARVAFQKRFNQGFLVSFSTDVTNTQAEVIQVEYPFNRKWTVSFSRDDKGNVSVMGRLRKTF